MCNILGVYLDHDLSVCLLQDGVITCHIEEERLTRIKHGLPHNLRGLWPQHAGAFGYVPWASMQYCLRAAGLSIADIDIIALPEGERGRHAAALIPVTARTRFFFSEEPAGAVHHYRHALSAAYASRFERAAVLVVDGDGSLLDGAYEAESAYLFDRAGGRCASVFKNRYRVSPGAPPLKPGLGWMYEYVSAMLGFVDAHTRYLAEPGKTMGLAPYGQPLPESADWCVPQGHSFDFSGFHDWLRRFGWSDLLRFDDRSLALIRRDAHIASHAADIAASVQAVLERSMLHLAQSVKQATGARHLCLAGGVALNSVCNGKIAQSAWFDDVFVQPAAADNGQAIGLAYHAHLESSASAPIQPIASAYGGRSYHDAEIDDALQAHDLASVRFDQAAALVQHVATLLADGKVVGWFQGGSEYGPRALGHRSILADPRSAEMKDHLNQHIKFREPFRPFAPSVLATHAHEVFALPCDSPYMLVVAPVRQAWRDRVPAITHVDGTARVQTVSPSVSPRYHALLEAFRVRTGIPLLLNTSFNLRGMPVVEHPADALRCFLLSGLDALVLGDNVVVQPSFEHVCFRVAPGWALEAGQRRLRHGVQLWPRFVSQAHDEAHRVDIDQVLLRTLMACDGQRFFTQALPFAAGDTPSLSAAQRTAMYGQCVAFCRRGWLELRVGHGRWMGQER